MRWGTSVQMDLLVQKVLIHPPEIIQTLLKCRLCINFHQVLHFILS